MVSFRFMQADFGKQVYLNEGDLITSPTAFSRTSKLRDGSGELDVWAVPGFDSPFQPWQATYSMISTISRVRGFTSTVRSFTMV